MALTLEELSDLVQVLQNKVNDLETKTEQYRQDINDLEYQLSQSVITKKVEAKQLNAEAVESTSITAGSNQGLGLGANTRTNDLYIDPSGIW